MDQLAGASAKLWLSLAKQLVNSFAPINNTLQKLMFSIESTYRAGHMGFLFLKIGSRKAKSPCKSWVLCPPAQVTCQASYWTSARSTLLHKDSSLLRQNLYKYWHRNAQHLSCRYLHGVLKSSDEACSSVRFAYKYKGLACPCWSIYIYIYVCVYMYTCNCMYIYIYLCVHL